MSELAFNLNGEPFELPGAAVGWRVRKMKPKGAPEVVYSRDGVPLILPIDADIDDLRRAARSEGRFRLDPVDEHNRMIANASAGYVCVPASESPPEPAQLASRAPTDNVAIEAMKLNTELARSIIDKFPMMIESAATLLRAADSAGITTRPPRILIDDEVDDDSEDDEVDQDEDPDEAAPKAGGLAGLIETLAPFVMPAIVNAIAGGKLKIPGGIGALLDCRRARPKARSHAEVPAPHATSTPGTAPAGAGSTSRTAAPRYPARGGNGLGHPPMPRARHGAPAASPPRTAVVTASAPMSSSAPSSPAASSPAPERPASGTVPASPVSTHPPASAAPESPAVIGLHDTQLEASPAGLASGSVDDLSPAAGAPSSRIAHRNELPAEIDAPAPHDHLHAVSAGEESELEVEPIDADDDGSMLASAGEPSTDSEDELPTLDAATLAHFVAIQGALTFREGMLARALAAELSPAELRAWMTELRQLSVDEAAARIRSVLADAADDDVAGGGS